MKQGVVTFEEPFFVVNEGIAIRNEKKVCLKLDWRISRAASCEICKVLNAAYKLGFIEGERALSKILQKND